MTEGPWAIAGAVAAIVVLGITGYDIFVRPIWRRFRLRNPCEVHFAIRPLQQATLDYIFQDDQGHRVKELVVPANQLVEIEIGYEPKIAFYEAELIFGCDGDDATKPFATECINRLIAVGKSHWIPGEDEGHWRDRHKCYHVLRNKPRAVGTHIAVGFMLQTGAPGTYPANVSFLTNEMDRTVSLKIRVEDKPHTRMRCHEKGHLGCYVRPMVKPH
jgi:hypothetical protein